MKEDMEGTEEEAAPENEDTDNVEQETEED